jgi:hypothetical protein
MADVFVSYDKDDREAAERIVQSLRRRGLSVWWDDDIAPHAPWDETIQRELDAAGKVLVLWTPNSINSRWVREESRLAQEAVPPKLIQAVLESCRVPFGFGSEQHIDLSDWTYRRRRHPGFEKLLVWLQSEGDGATSLPSPESPPIEAPPPLPEADTPGAPMGTETPRDSPETPPAGGILPIRRYAGRIIGLAVVLVSLIWGVATCQPAAVEDAPGLGAEAAAIDGQEAGDAAAEGPPEMAADEATDAIGEAPEEAAPAAVTTVTYVNEMTCVPVDASQGGEFELYMRDNAIAPCLNGELYFVNGANGRRIRNRLFAASRTRAEQVYIPETDIFRYSIWNLSPEEYLSLSRVPDALAAFQCTDVGGQARADQMSERTFRLRLDRPPDVQIEWECHH